MGQDKQMQMVGVNANQNLNGNGNLVAARTEGNAAGPRRRNDAYLQTQLLIAQSTRGSAIFTAVGSLFFWQWELSSLAMGTTSGSGNSITGSGNALCILFPTKGSITSIHKCVYYKFDESGKEVIICLYVDDMLIFGTDQNQVDKTKEFLSLNFSMKHIGEADVILGIRIKRENEGLTITQSHYIEKILKKFSCEGFGPVSTPIEIGIKIMPHMGKPVNQLEYSRAIRCLMYAMTSTRPDIAYAVGKLSRFTSNLSYSDASWITNSEDHTSTTALATAGKEAKWLRNLIYEIPLWPKPISLISMHCDSAATLAKAYSQIYNGKSRHLGVRNIMVRELITNGVISVDFVRSQQNLADHLTKGLARD
nr:zinc finger, CCHC-type [Tanacetum cinerariifolium]